MATKAQSAAVKRGKECFNSHKNELFKAIAKKKKTKRPHPPSKKQSTSKR